MSRTLQELRDQAVFNQELFFESITNRGTGATGAMSFVGSPVYRRVGNLVGLAQVAAADGTTSGAVASLLDVTGTITFEVAAIAYTSGFDVWMYQVTGGGGGYQIRTDLANTRAEIILNTAAGATARMVYTNASTFVLGKSTHAIITSTTGGTAGAAWIDGVSTTANLFGVGVAANSGAAVVLAGGGGSGKMTSFLVRAWQGALDAAEVQQLYQAYSTLVVNSRV